MSNIDKRQHRVPAISLSEIDSGFGFDAARIFLGNHLLLIRWSDGLQDEVKGKQFRNVESKLFQPGGVRKVHEQACPTHKSFFPGSFARAKSLKCNFASPS